MQTISERWRVANTPPTLRAKPRADNAKRWVADIETSLRRYPGFGTSGPPHGSDLEAQVASLFWYHTIELPGGIATPGFFDHRKLVPHYGLPDDLRGKRVLDVGTWDGFWAFELERRGADVTAIDLEGLSEVDLNYSYRKALEESGLKQYYGNGFELARQALGSKVKRVQLSVYDLDPSVLGTFDVVHMGDVLLHLESPTRALRRLRSVTSDTAIVANPYDPSLEGDQVRYQGGWWDIVWWTTSLDALGQMILDAGFASAEIRSAYEGRQSPNDPWYPWVVVHAKA